MINEARTMAGQDSACCRIQRRRPSVAQHPSVVYPGRKWLFWQYSGSGLSHGVDGRIDLNVFNGSEDAWHRWVDRRSS